MTAAVTAAPVSIVGDSVTRVQPAPSFIDALVARVAEDLGVAVEEVRRLAAEIHVGFATARIHVFVPILVEKRLRERLSRLHLDASAREPD